MEVNIPLNVKLKAKDNEWSAIATRKSDDKTFPVFSMLGLTPSEVYQKFGVKVPEAEQSEEPVEDAKSVIEDAIKKVNKSTNMPSSDVVNILLDAYNKLGGKEVEEELQ